jgi:hypothetical protein
MLSGCFCTFQLAFFTTLCVCFPATNKNLATKTNTTDPNIIAIVLQKPGAAKSIGVGAVENRKLKEIFGWLQPIFSSAVQATGEAVNNMGSAGGNLINSVFGGQNTYAYPFPFRR